MYDTLSVLDNEEKIIKEKNLLTLDMSTPNAVDAADKLIVSAEDKETKLTPSFSLQLETLKLLDSTIPRMAQFLDEQLILWQKDAAKEPENEYILNNTGNAFLSRGNVEKAINCFQAAIKINKDFGQAKFNLARAFVMQDKLEDALHILTELNKDNPSNITFLINIARIHIRMENLEAANKVLDEVITINSNMFTAYYTKGIINLLEKKADKAISYFRKSISLNTKFVDGYVALAISFLMLNNFGKAIRNLMTAQTIASHKISLTKLLAKVYELKGDYEDASKQIVTYLNKYPNDIEARHIAAFTYFKKTDYANSLEQLLFLHKFYEQNQDNERLSAVVNNIGVLKHKLGKIKDAEILFKSSIDYSERPNPITYFNLAKLYVEINDQKNAKWILDKYISFAPNDERPLILLATYHMLREEADEAETLLNKVLNLNPKSNAAFLLLSELYCEIADDCDRSIDICRRGLEIYPQNNSFLNNLAYSLLRTSYSKSNEQREALVNEAKSILDKIDWDGAAYVEYATKGLLLITENKIDEGKKFYDIAANRAPNNEVKQMVRQKKRVELARYWILKGNQLIAGKLLHDALKINTVAKIYTTQALGLLRQIEK